MMPIAIETKQLTKVFDRAKGWQRAARKPSISAVSDVTLKVQSGEMFGLLGPNGAGKTTLVKMLATLILPSSGTAAVAGHSLHDAAAIRASVGLVVSDERSFYWRLSARRNLDFFAALYGLHGQEASHRIDTVLAHVDLQAEADRRFSNLSSGMKQRLSIARSLLHQPSILFLDEPSRSLDPTATSRLHQLLLQIRSQQEITIFLITHDLAEAEKLCQRVAVMHQGRIRIIGHPGELRRRLRPQQQYTVRTGMLSEDSAAALDSQFPGVGQQRAGSHSLLTFQAADEDGALAKLLDFLRDNRIGVQGIEGSPPTLDEVFAHFTTEPGDG